MAEISRGFRGRRPSGIDPARLPPGQYQARRFPVLSAGPTPHTPLSEWTFGIDGDVWEPRSWSWEEFRPQVLVAAAPARPSAPQPRRRGSPAAAARPGANLIIQFARFL
jgi:hypothetical protein